jgi:uncharacterized membrane protein
MAAVPSPNSSRDAIPLPYSWADQAPPSRKRIDSIDLLRGIVMVIMMLDHTRDFVHVDVLQGRDPTDLSRTNVILFFTRWITHFCAPVFVFLAGTGIFLQTQRGKSKGDISRFLITRGLWLIVLEFTVVRTSVLFSFDYRFLGMAQVIWVIGMSMIILAALIHLPLWAVGTFGALLIALHNLFDGFRVEGWKGPASGVPGIGSKVWIILHQPFEGFPIAGFPSPVVFVIYPLIPWVGVMALGYAFGIVYRWDPERRRRLLIRAGLAATALFIVMRAIDVYGDPAKWSSQKNFIYTVLAFLNTTKYPPSLLFLLMTLGPALLALAWFERSTERGGGTRGVIGALRNAFVTFGRVPLFFYLLQWPTAHLISLIVHWVAGKPIGWMFNSPVTFQPPPPGSGFSLYVVYACWIAGVLLLYPLCKWFAGVKQRRRDWWLSYL